MKYVILTDPRTDYVLPAVFADEFTHKGVAERMQEESPGSEIMGAGYVKLENGRAVTYGESTSLKMKPEATDSLVLTYFLISGLSGLSLHNHLTAKAFGL